MTFHGLKEDKMCPLTGLGFWWRVESSGACSHCWELRRLVSPLSPSKVTSTALNPNYLAVDFLWLGRKVLSPPVFEPAPQYPSAYNFWRFLGPIPRVRW